MLLFALCCLKSKYNKIEVEDGALPRICRNVHLSFHQPSSLGITMGCFFNSIEKVCGRLMM